MTFVISLGPGFPLHKAPHRRSGAAAPAPGTGTMTAGRDVITRAVIACGSVGVAWGIQRRYGISPGSGGLL